MLEKNLVVGPFQCNCRLLVCERTGHSVLIDPGDESQRIIEEISRLRTPSGVPIQISYLFHTHGHLDHIGGTRGVSESLVAAGRQAPKIAIHPDDVPLYANLKMQGSLFGMEFDDPLPIHHSFQDEETLQVGDLKFSILHTPGHSPGSVCIRLLEDSSTGAPESLFSGDTLFYQSVGRTDLWGGNQDQMFKSIRNRIFSLDDDTRVCPGHGPETLVGVEKRSNPFFR